MRVLFGYFLNLTPIFILLVRGTFTIISITMLCTWLCAIRLTHANLSTFHAILNNYYHSDKTLGVLTTWLLYG